MTTGRQIAYKISEKRDEIQRKARIVTDNMARQERELAGVVQEQAKLLQQLASIHLKLDVPLPKNIETMMLSREKRIDESKVAIKTHEKEIAELRDQREVVARDTNAAFEVYDKANKEAHLVYEADEEVARLRNHLSTVSDTLNSLNGKLKRAKAELAEKRVGYEEDPYFGYLVKRGFGTPEYKNFGITKRVDSWLANLISFDRKKRDLSTLHAIPEWVQARIDKVKVDHDADAAALAVIFDRTHSDVAPLKKKLDAVNGRLKDIDSSISTLRQTVRELNDFISDVAAATDQDLYQITKVYAEQLKKLGVSNLHALAAQTEGKEDDQLVAKISALEATRNNIAMQIQNLAPGKQEFERRIKALDEVERKLKGRGWSGSSDNFGNKAEEQIDNLATGVITAAAMWDVITRSHRPDTDYYSSGHSSSTSSWGGSSSNTSTWGSSSSSSDSGGFGGSSSWSSGGGFGGGDSSTGGGF